MLCTHRTTQEQSNQIETCRAWLEYTIEFDSFNEYRRSSLTARRRLENTNSQADYDLRRIRKLRFTIESQQEELHRAQEEECGRRDQQLLHEQVLNQNWYLREAHEKSLSETEELKKFQQDEDQSRIRILFWNSQVRYRN